MKKHIILFASLLFSAALANAQTLKTPSASPSTTIKQDFALSNIELSYSRPSVKGRNIFGDLVPYGKVWRTGANSATTISFGEEVSINGTKVKAGKYGILTIPEAGEWTIIITKQLDVTSPAAYKAEQDVVRVKVPVTSLPFSVENFTIMIGNIASGSCEVWFIWDNTMVALPISADVESQVMQQIDRVMNNDNRPYFSAAMYYLDNNKDLNKALEWFNKAAETDPKAYWVQFRKADCLAKLGRKQEAIATAEKSLALAREAKNEDYVKLNEDLIKKLK
jgi:TPR repeat protein